MKKYLKYIIGLLIFIIGYRYLTQPVFNSSKKLLNTTIMQSEYDNNNIKHNHHMKIHHYDAFTEKLLAKSLKITQIITSNDYDYKTDNLIKLAQAYNKFNQKTKAESIIDIAINNNAQENEIRSSNFNDIASYFIESGNRQDAIKNLEIAFTAAKKITDLDDRDYTFIDLGENYARLGLYKRALDCAELIEDDYLQATQLYTSLIAEYIARQQYEQVNIIINKTIETGWENWILEEAVKSYLEQEDFQRAFAAIEMMTQEQARVNSLSDIAQKYLELNDQLAAEKNLQKAQTIANNIQNSNTKSWSLLAISRVYKQLEQTQDSGSFVSQAVTEIEQIQDPFSKSIIFNSLAFELASVGKYDQALEIIESDNLSISRSQKIRLLIKIAEQYQKLDQPEKATMMIDLAMGMATKLKSEISDLPDDVAQSFSLNDIADYALENQQYDLAFNILEQVKTLDGKAHLLVKMGFVSS